MKFSDKLIQLRREKGYSQEQFAGLLDVSRQSVSKWEAGQSTPEINKLITIADIFHVSVDDLIREDYELPDSENRQVRNEKTTANGNNNTAYIPARMYGFYEYKSKIRIFGLPLIHIKTGYGLQVARGIIAFGNIAIGVISIGGISLGGLCFGGVSLGLIALAGCAIGGIAAGGFALGLLAIGGMAVGMYAYGGLAVASRIAIGGAPFAPTSIGGRPRGDHILKVTETVTGDQIRSFILEHSPRIWKPLLKLLTFFAEILSTV